MITEHLNLVGNSFLSQLSDNKHGDDAHLSTELTVLLRFAIVLFSRIKSPVSIDYAVGRALSLVWPKQIGETFFLLPETEF
jgi:hypothetical protein